MPFRFLLRQKHNKFTIIVVKILPKDLGKDRLVRQIVRNNWITGSIEGLIPRHI